MKTYIKKIISAENELKFIKLDLIESRKEVDNIILVEVNYTHSGLYKEYIDDQLFNSFFSEDDKKRIIRIKADISSLVRFNSIIPDDLHFNERINRGIFSDYIDLNKNDIIFSLDADEVLYESSFSKIKSKIIEEDKGFLIKLHNLMYRPDYLCENYEFIAPTVCKVKFYNNPIMRIKSRFKKYKQWRYHGEILKDPMGVHFNWHLTPKEIMKKLVSYSHSDKFHNKIFDESYYYNLIKNKKYIDEDVSFEIKKLDLRNENILPKSFYDCITDFQYLLI